MEHRPDLTTIITSLEGVAKIARDIVAAARTMTDNEARYAVDYYYALQDFRIRTAGMIRSVEKGDASEPHEFLDWMLKQANLYESSIKRGLESYSIAQPEHPWLDSVVGIGPVISAGLAAHIDIRKAPTVGHIWRFAGLDPTLQWGKGQKRPFNAKLKVLCWKIGESFVKVSGREDAFYGQVYRQRRALEGERNEAGHFAAQAAQMLEKRPTHAQRETYKQGKLPDGHLHSRAKRYAVKLFLAHYHHVVHVLRMGAPPPKPYVIEHGGHAHYIGPPGFSQGN